MMKVTRLLSFVFPTVFFLMIALSSFPCLAAIEETTSGGGGQNNDEDSREYLFVAAVKGDVNVIKAILAEKPHLVNAVDSNGWSVLHEVIRFRQLEPIQYLLNEGVGADFALPNNDGDSPLDLARKFHPTDDDMQNYFIHFAASRGYVRFLEKVFDERDQRLLTPDANGWTILHEAASTGQVQTLDFLRRVEAELGLDMISVKTKDDKSALQIANELHSDNTDLIKLLEAWSNGVHTAAAKGEIDTLKTIKEVDPSKLEAEDHNGWTPIHEAVRGGQTDSFNFLLSFLAGSDTNARNHILTKKTKGGDTLLDIARKVHGEEHDIYKTIEDL